MHQITFANGAYRNPRKPTRHKRLLANGQKAVLWLGPGPITGPHYPKAKSGRPSGGLELGICSPNNSSIPSDLGAEVLPDSQTMQCLCRH